MTICPKLLRALAASAILMVAPLALAVPNRFETIDYPGATKTFVYGINPAGDMVGAWDDAAGVEHGFLLHDGTFASFDYPGAKWTDAYGISSQGEIVGQYGLPNDPTTHGFIFKDGVFTPVELAGPTDLGSRNSMPFGVMPDGTMVGCYHQSTSTGIVAGSMHGFMLKGTDLSFTGANMMTTAVNAGGVVTGYGTGYATGATADHGYVVSEGTVSWFSVPGSLVTRPRGISANGDIAGVYQDSANAFHGFLYRQGTFARIDVPGATATRPMTMNAIGDIAGYYNDAKGAVHGFVFRKTGMWWNPSQPGTGFMMERQGNNMMVMPFVYSYDGTPMWMSATGSFSDGMLSTPAHMYTGGQTMMGGYHMPVDMGGQGLLQVQFADDGSAKMIWTPNPFMWNTSTLQRFGFTGGPGTWGPVENGFWSSTSEPGRTFAIEVQDGTLWVLGAMYDEAGRPTWYLSAGAMADPMQYSGNWTQYGQGPTMLGVGGPSSVLNANAGSLKVKFSDAQHGTLTLSDGRQITIARSSF